jgi:hypothetical protein
MALIPVANLGAKFKFWGLEPRRGNEIIRELCHTSTHPRKKSKTQYIQRMENAVLAKPACSEFRTVLS